MKSADRQMTDPIVDVSSFEAKPTECTKMTAPSEAIRAYITGYAKLQETTE
jgi:hypothetical protein